MKTICLFMALLTSGLVIAQTLHTVDNNSPSAGDFTSLSAAIDAAAAGDTIYIVPSTISYGAITLTKVLHLRGAGHAPEVTNGTASKVGNISLNIPIGGAGITISGLDFNDLGVVGAQPYPDLQVSNCLLRRITAGSTLNQCNNWIILGNVINANTFNVINKSNSQGWIVSNNYIRTQATSVTWSLFANFDATDIVRNNIVVNQINNGAWQLLNACQGMLIENTIFVFNGNSTGFNLAGNSATFHNCLTYSYPGQSLTALPGEDNLDNQDPQFADIGTNPYFEATKDFSLQPTSPGAGYGTDGQDIGLFGSDFNFSYRGYPQDMPYITFMEITNAIVGQGGVLNVNFEAKAQ